MHVLVPANAQVLLSVIFEYVTFDLFDTSALTDSFYSPSEVEVSDSLDQLGYESAFCLINLGSFIYFVVGQLVVLFLQAFFLAIFRLKCWHGRSNLTSKRVDNCKKYFERQLSGVFWKTILTTIDGA